MDEHCPLDDRFVNLPRKVMVVLTMAFPMGFPLWPEANQRAFVAASHQDVIRLDVQMNEAQGMPRPLQIDGKIDGIHGCEQMASFYRWSVHQKWWCSIAIRCYQCEISFQCEIMMMFNSYISEITRGYYNLWGDQIWSCDGFPSSYGDLYMGYVWICHKKTTAWSTTVV